MAKKQKHQFTIASTGDIHVGLNVEELDRTPEALSALDAFVDWCVEHRPDLAEIGGDIFDYNHPLSSHLAAVMQRLRRLDEAEIFTAVMMGNHDAIVDPEQRWAGTPFEQAGYQHVRFYTEPIIVNHGALRFMMLPHITKASAQKKGFKTPQDYLETWARQQLDKEAMDVVFSHLNVWCAKVGTEALMLRQSDLQLPAWMVDDDRVGIIVNHHVHTPQEFGKVFLPGSPLCTDFGDVEANKSFLTMKLTDEGWVMDRVATPQSPLQEFELDFTGKDAKAMAALEKQAMKLVLPDAIVKLRVLIEEERLGEIDVEQMQTRFRKVCQWVKQTQCVPVRKRAVRDGQQHAGLEPKTAVDVYLNRAKPEGADRKRALAMQFLAGETPAVQLGTLSESGNEEELDTVLANVDEPPVPVPLKTEGTTTGRFKADRPNRAAAPRAGVSLEV